MTAQMRDRLQAPDDLQGAVIQRVQPGSPSDDAGLQPGQVIVGVNRHETKSAADVQKALTSIPKDKMRWCSSGLTVAARSASFTLQTELKPLLSTALYFMAKRSAPRYSALSFAQEYPSARCVQRERRGAPFATA